MSGHPPSRGNSINSVSWPWSRSGDTGAKVGDPRLPGESSPIGSRRLSGDYSLGSPVRSPVEGTVSEGTLASLGALDGGRATELCSSSALEVFPVSKEKLGSEFDSKQIDWDRSAELADKKQADLFRLQWGLIRDQLGNLSQELCAVREDFNYLKVSCSRAQERLETDVPARHTELQTGLAQEVLERRGNTDELQRLIAEVKQTAEKEARERCSGEERFVRSVQQAADNLHQERSSREGTDRNLAEVQKQLEALRLSLESTTARSIQQLKHSFEKESKDSKTAHEELKRYIAEVLDTVEQEKSERSAGCNTFRTQITSLQKEITEERAARTSLRSNLQGIEGQVTGQIQDLRQSLEAEGNERSTSHSRLEQRCVEHRDLLTEHRAKLAVHDAASESHRSSLEDLAASLAKEKLNFEAGRTEFKDGHRSLEQRLQDGLVQSSREREAGHTELKKHVEEACGSDVKAQAEHRGSLASVQDTVRKAEAGREASARSHQEAVEALQRRFRDELAVSASGYDAGLVEIREMVARSSEREKTAREERLNKEKAERDSRHGSLEDSVEALDRRLRDSLGQAVVDRDAREAELQQLLNRAAQTHPLVDVVQKKVEDFEEQLGVEVSAREALRESIRQLLAKEVLERDVVVGSVRDGADRELRALEGRLDALDRGGSSVGARLREVEQQAEGIEKETRRLWDAIKAQASHLGGSVIRLQQPSAAPQQASARIPIGSSGGGGGGGGISPSAASAGGAGGASPSEVRSASDRFMMQPPSSSSLRGHREDGLHVQTSVVQQIPVVQQVQHQVRQQSPTSSPILKPGPSPIATLEAPNGGRVIRGTSPMPPAVMHSPPVVMAVPTSASQVLGPDAWGEVLPIIRKSVRKSVYLQVPALKRLNQEQLNQVLEGTVASRYKRWDTIVAQGQPFDQIMMLEEGQCLEYDGCAADLQSKEFSSARCVEHMYSGDTFGTDRTIGKKGVMAPFTLVAITDCTVLCIPKKFLLGTTALPRACYSLMPDKAAPASARKSRSGSEEKEGSPRKGGSEKMDKPEKEKRKSRIAIQREDIEMDDDSGTKKEPADEKSAPTGRRRTKDGSSEEELSPRTVLLALPVRQQGGGLRMPWFEGMPANAMFWGGHGKFQAPTWRRRTLLSALSL